MKLKLAVIASGTISLFALTLASAAQAELPAMPWSADLYLLGVGASSGHVALPSAGVYEPNWTLSFGLGVSFWYVYAGAGFDLIHFRDAAPLVQNVIGGPDGTVSSEASAASGNLELGLNYPFMIRLHAHDFIELVPRVTYGTYGVGDVTRDVSNCVNCQSQTIPVDYRGGSFLGLGLGSFWASGEPLRGAFGLTTSYRRFLHPGDASLTSQLLFSLTIRVAGH